MIDVVAQAIVEKFNSSNLRGSLEYLYFQQAPQGKTFPYGVFYFNGTTQEEIMGSAFNNITSVDIQFNLFTDDDDGGETISKLTELLDETYHWQNLYIDGWTYVKMQRTATLNIAYVDEIWQSSTDYELWIQKESV